MTGRECAASRLIFQLKGASRVLCLPGLPVAVKLADRSLGRCPRANIYSAAGASDGASQLFICLRRLITHFLTFAS